MCHSPPLVRLSSPDDDDHSTHSPTAIKGEALRVDKNGGVRALCLLRTNALGMKKNMDRLRMDRVKEVRARGVWECLQLTLCDGSRKVIHIKGEMR